MTKEGSSKIVNLISIKAWGLMLGCGYTCISHCSEYALIFLLILYSYQYKLH